MAKAKEIISERVANGTLEIIEGIWESSNGKIYAIERFEDDVKFDFVFIDANKREYPEYYRLVFDKVRVGGIIVADDVLWDGKVVTEGEKTDAQTRGILDFNDMVQADERVENLLLPVRHGLMLMRKTKA